MRIGEDASTPQPPRADKRGDSADAMVDVGERNAARSRSSWAKRSARDKDDIFGDLLCETRQTRPCRLRSQIEKHCSL